MKLLFIAILATTLAQPQTNGFDSARLKLIPARMQKFVDEREIAGTVTLVRKGGVNVLLAANGWADREAKIPMMSDTVFQVMSMTKPVTALAVMICAERGLLNLDDPVERFIPELADLKVTQADGSLVKKKSRLTIRHLLTHTSGFPSIDPGGLDDDQKIKVTLKQYAALMPSLPLIAEPGERISYSGPGIALAGRIVEIASGQSLQDFVQSAIFDPLSMKDTSFFYKPNYSGRMARLHESERSEMKVIGGDPKRPGAIYANPAGGLYSTAQDMANFLECIVNGGALHGKRLVSPRACKTMTTLQTGELLSDGTDAQGYGLGFSVVRSARGTANLKPIGAFGHTGAYGTEFWADPSQKFVVVFMSQSFSDRVHKTFNTMVNAAYTSP